MQSGSSTPLYDGQGNQRAVTSSSQSVTATQNYDAFGNLMGSTGGAGSPFQYGAASGYRTDGDAGLQQVGARYYDAQVGRFITRDTYLDQKPYLYCDHDPVNNTDPTGHASSPPGTIGGHVIIEVDWSALWRDLEELFNKIFNPPGGGTQSVDQPDGYPHRVPGDLPVKPSWEQSIPGPTSTSGSML